MFLLTLCILLSLNYFTLNSSHEEQTGHRIEQVPVLWIERKASKVKIMRVMTDYVFNLVKLRFRIWHLKHF